MYHFNQHLHFVGIGGVGMAGIAEVLLNLGYTVSGSDLKDSPLIQHLVQLGAKVSLGHVPENVDDSVTVVVVSSAVRPDNPELVAAHERNLPVIPRAEMLSELMRMKYGIAVAGSHGKTSTTSMIGKILSYVGLDPTVILGGRVLSTDSGARLGMGQYLVAEADESDGTFCLLRPVIATVSNIDYEHLEHYGSFGALEQSFVQFMGAIPFYGLVVACFDDPVVARIARGLRRRVVSYGLHGEHEFAARDISISGVESTFQLISRGVDQGYFCLPMPGQHFVSNALAAIAVATEVGVTIDECRDALAAFPGVARRTELLGRCKGISVIDDYGHHPTEIKATLRAVRAGFIEAGAQRRLVVVFQPHRYSRTRELFSDFVQSFTEADQVLVSTIYGAGEEVDPGVSGEYLARSIQHPGVKYIGKIEEAVPLLAKTLQSGDVVVFLGAGSVTKVAHVFFKYLESNE